MAQNTNTNEARACAKYVRIAPRKARLVVDQIRNLPVERALEILTFSERAAAVPVAKVLRSAVANAQNNHGIRGDLYVKLAYVDEGPTIKRFRPRAKGSASRINQRTCQTLSSSHLERRRKGNGTEGTPHRLPSGHHRAVAFPLVRR